MAKLAAGSKAPQFDLQTDSGKRLKLSDLKGKKVVVYFYPKDDTSGCTIEAIDFTKAKAAFEKAGTTVIGISPDSEDSHCTFRDKHGLGIPLAADPDHQAIDASGVGVE
jgi:thioredoxin-dependent peroxiredoxin